MWGYYGKVPAHGDFVRHRAEAAFVTPWDAWLQHGVAASRGALGPAWDGAYQSAPLWRFVLGPGVCGHAPILGVMMPSQDRVGRRFPLTIFTRLGPAAGVPALDEDARLAPVENAALAMLDAVVDQAQLRARLDAIPVPAATGGGSSQPRGSIWLSTFFGGAARQDWLRFDALPPPQAFTTLMTLEEVA